MPKPTLRAALEAFCATIEATGGLTDYASPDSVCPALAPVGDPEWLDLGDAYLAACAALGREPAIEAGRG